MLSDVGKGNNLMLTKLTPVATLALKQSIQFKDVYTWNLMSVVCLLWSEGKTQWSPSVGLSELLCRLTVN